MPRVGRGGHATAISFEAGDTQLAGVAQQQGSLAAAVAAGELWLEASVAERATGRCEQAIREIDDLLTRASSRSSGNSVTTRTELTGLGIDLNSRKPVNRLGLVGCGWQGKSFTLDMERDKDAIASCQARTHDPAFTSFAENTVGGRVGVRFSVDRARDDCTQLMDGGPVSLWVAVAPAGLSDQKIDSCAEALRIAQLIEP